MSLTLVTCERYYTCTYLYGGYALVCVYYITYIYIKRINIMYSMDSTVVYFIKCGAFSQRVKHHLSKRKPLHCKCLHNVITACFSAFYAESTTTVSHWTKSSHNNYVTDHMALESDRMTDHIILLLRFSSSTSIYIVALALGHVCELCCSSINGTCQDSFWLGLSC